MLVRKGSHLRSYIFHPLILTECLRFLKTMSCCIVNEFGVRVVEDAEANEGTPNGSRSDARIAKRLNSLIIASGLATVTVLPKVLKSNFLCRSSIPFVGA